MRQSRFANIIQHFNFIYKVGHRCSHIEHTSHMHVWLEGIEGIYPGLEITLNPDMYKFVSAGPDVPHQR